MAMSYHPYGLKVLKDDEDETMIIMMMVTKGEKVVKKIRRRLPVLSSNKLMPNLTKIFNEY
jgi:hypothetical protein